MPISINGSGTITGISAGGLPDGCVQLADLATTGTASSSTFLRGDASFAEAGGGKILQIVENAYYTATTITGSASATGCTATITPTKAGSKIFVIANQSGQYRVNSDPSCIISIYLDRDIASAGYNNVTYQQDLGGSFPNNRRSARMTTITYLDSPSYTLGQAIAYRIRAGGYTSNYGLQYNAQQHGGTANPSTMTLMEVAA